MDEREVENPYKPNDVPCQDPSADKRRSRYIWEGVSLCPFLWLLAYPTTVFSFYQFTGVRDPAGPAVIVFGSVFGLIACYIVALCVTPILFRLAATPHLMLPMLLCLSVVGSVLASLLLQIRFNGRMLVTMKATIELSCVLGVPAICCCLGFELHQRMRGFDFM